MTRTSKGFPDENARPSEKVKEDWLRQYAEAVWSTTGGLESGQLGFPSRALYRELWNYALGRQGIDQYIKLSGIDPKHAIFEDDHSRLPLSNRFFNIIVGLVEKQGWKIRVGTIDPQAKIELKSKQADRKTRLMMRQAMPEAAEHPMIAAMPGEPDDLEGLDIMAMGERHPIAADAQDVARAVFNWNKYPRIRREAIQWWFITGAAVIKDSTECDGIPVECVPLGEFIIPYCRYADFSDASHMGRVKRVLISSLPSLSKGKVDKAKLKALRENGNGGWFTGSNLDEDEWWNVATCEVLDLEIRTTDTIRKEEYVNREGNKRYRDVVIKKDGTEKEVQGSKKISYELENIYTVQWIIGTDIVFGCGKQLNMKREPNNPAKCMFSYHVVAPGIREMRPYSRMQAIRPMVDDVQVMNYKRRWTLARAVPSGYAIDYDGLEDIDLNGGGKALGKKELLDLFVRTGNLIYRQKTVNGQQRAIAKPIEFIKGGIGDEVLEYSNQIAYNIDLIRQTLGLNDITDGSTPNAKNLNSTNQAAMLGTNNAISDLFFADKQLAEDVAGSVIIRAWDMLREDENGNSFADTLAAIVGQDTVDRIKNAPRLDAYKFGITIEDDPSPAEVEDFNGSLNEAMGAGQITVDEKMMAKTIAAENLLQAQLYLSYRVRKNIQRQSDEAARREQSNAQLQQQSAVVAEQAKQQTIQIQLQADIERMKVQHQFDMEKLGAQGGVTLEKERISSTGRVEASYVQAKERDTSNIRNNTSNLIKEGKGDEVDKVNIPADLQSRVEPLTSEQHPALPKAAFSFIKPVMPDAEPLPINEQQGETMPEMQEAA